jgi:hypothetical protein
VQKLSAPGTALVGFALAALLLLGCGGGDDADPTVAASSRDPQSANYTPPASTTDTSAPRTATATAEPAEPTTAPQGSIDGYTAQELLDLSAEASHFITSMRYQSKIGPDSAGNYIDSTSEVIPPDRLRETQRMGEQTRTVVQVGDKAYLREGEGPWAPIEGAQPYVFPPPEQEQGPPYVPVVLRYEPVEGRNCAVVSFEQQVSLQQQRYVEFVQWICEDDYLVRRSEVYDVQSGEKTLQAASEKFEYNVPIDPIELPE